MCNKLRMNKLWLLKKKKTLIGLFINNTKRIQSSNLNSKKSVQFFFFLFELVQPTKKKCDKLVKNQSRKAKCDFSAFLLFCSKPETRRCHLFHSTQQTLLFRLTISIEQNFHSYDMILQIITAGPKPFRHAVCIQCTINFLNRIFSTIFLK